MSTFYLRLVVRGSPPFQRSALIERLIARASAASRVVDWRADAFGLVAPGTPMPAVGALALRGVAAAGAWVCVATPVHLSAGMTHVTFPADGILSVDLADAVALAADFNGVFAGAGVQLVVGQAGVLLCVFEQALDVVTRDPEAAVGQDVFGFQPSGNDAPRLRRLTSEIEMWLFDHAVNRQRTLRGRVPITGLWLWGGGAIHGSTPLPSVWAAGGDIFFEAFGNASQLPRESGSGVVAVNDYPGSSTWSEVELRWLRPALAELRAGRLGQIHVSAGQCRFTIPRGMSWRFWQRAQPWWTSFDSGNGENYDSK